MTTRRTSFLVLITVALTLCASGARAWSPAGHMALGAIAYRELERIDPQALEAVLALLEEHPHYRSLLARPDDLDPEVKDMGVFMRAVRWADDVRRPPYDEYSRPAWHYVNFHYRPPDELTPPRSPDQDGYLLVALDENVRRLENGSDTVRAVALTWLLHLVTDIHQPLHDIALVDAARPGGDRGGNETFVRPWPGADTVNLHWLWDGLVHGDENPRTAIVRAAELTVTHRHLFEQRLDSVLGEEDFRDWATEGARIAVEHAYLRGRLQTGTERNGAVVPGGYLDRARRVARERAVIGALRLAHLLSRLF